MEVNDKQDEAVISLDSSNLSNNPSELVDLLTKIEDEIRKSDQQIEQLRKKKVSCLPSYLFAEFFETNKKIIKLYFVLGKDNKILNA